VSRRTERTQISGRHALAVVLALAVLLASVIVVQAVFADRTGIRRRTPVVRYVDGGASAIR